MPSKSLAYLCSLLFALPVVLSSNERQRVQEALPPKTYGNVIEQALLLDGKNSSTISASSTDVSDILELRQDVVAMETAQDILQAENIYRSGTNGNETQGGNSK